MSEEHTGVGVGDRTLPLGGHKWGLSLRRSRTSVTFISKRNNGVVLEWIGLIKPKVYTVP